QITLNVSSMVPGTISGTVRDQNGDTVDDADVELQDDQGNTVETTQTDNNGEYSFTGVDPGDYTVIATKTGYKSDQGDVTLGSGGSETRDLQIEQGTIRGKVVDEDGKGIEDADVELRDDNGNLVRETTTDGSGNFRFDDLPLGTYTVIIKASGYDTRTEDGVVVDEDDNDNSMGSLDVTPEAAAGNFLADYWWLLLIIIIIVVVLILVVMLAKRKKPAPEEAPPEYATAQVPAEQAPPYQEAPAEQPPYQEAPPEQYPEEPQPETPPEETPPETPPEE
ncbi:MAG: carboxypeptidase-like regulatory domain-containing protein, partial [Thermoplasmata archaeon]